MKENGSPALEFETDDDRSYFLIRLPVNLQTSAEDTLVKTRVEILGALKREPHLANAELAEAVGISKKGVEWQIKRLKDDS